MRLNSEAKTCLSPFSLTGQEDSIKGYNYDLGIGVRPSRAKAETHYLRAAKNGEKIAQYNLAQMYYEGGKKADLKKAIFWWGKAAENGHPLAQCNLGRSYEDGEGVRKNIQKAKEFYAAAAKQSNAIARFNLARLKAFDGLRAAAQTAFKSVVPELKKLARQKDADAMICLAQCAYHGWGMTTSKQQAVKWYRSAAKTGKKGAFLGLGYCYQDGDGVRKDTKKAGHYFALASGLKSARKAKI
jgi:TPR repeat protein